MSFLKMRFPIVIIGAMFLLFLDSCQMLNPNIMLRTNRKYVFDTLSKDSTVGTEFRIKPDDIVEFRLYANDGVKMVDVLNDRSLSSMAQQEFQYVVDVNGLVKLPLLGMEKLEGMTLREAEKYLEMRYSTYYVEPFVVLRVVNRRIIIFPGDPGDAKVLALGNTNITVMEALAMAGGISASGRAKHVKLIRQTDDPKKPTKIYKLDLSTINGLADANTVLQSGDIIYVQPREQIVKRTLGEVAPTLSLITSLITFYYVISRLP